MEERISAIKQQLLDHLDRENEKGLQNLFEVTHPSDLGAVFEKVAVEQARELFRYLPENRKSDILEELTPGRSVRLLAEYEEEDMADLLEGMAPDDAADIFLTCEKELQERLLSRIDDDEFRQILIDLVSYPADSAGGIMTTEYIVVNEEVTVKEAIETARRRADDAEMFYFL